MNSYHAGWVAVWLLIAGPLAVSARAFTDVTVEDTNRTQRDALLRPDRRINHTHSGYVPVNKDLGSELFYIFWEATDPVSDLDTTPIILWLQGGPGCASMFGAMYINGPYFLSPELALEPNPGAWNQRFGLLYVDQPIGTGFSHAGKDAIPDNELLMAQHLYTGLQAFYTRHRFHNRPLFITGESYAGKYVPSISHFIVQAEAMARGTVEQLQHARPLPSSTPAPVFKFGGMAVGNGWVDAPTQLGVQAEVAWSFGLIDSVQRRTAELLVQQTIEHMENLRWNQARKASDLVMAFITNASASASLEDIRRNLAYDGHRRTDAFWSLPEVQHYIGASRGGTGPGGAWQSCSPRVDAIMGHDIMLSVRKLVPDVIAAAPVLIYLGQFDAECGVASNDAWMTRLEWPGHFGYATAPRKLWMLNGTVAGYRKSYGNLTQLVIRNAGHMVPHDRPLEARAMLNEWVLTALGIDGPKAQEVLPVLPDVPGGVPGLMARPAEGGVAAAAGGGDAAAKGEPVRASGRAIA